MMAGKNHDKKSANDGSNSHFGPQGLHSRRYLESDCAQCQEEFFPEGENPLCHLRAAARDTPAATAAQTCLRPHNNLRRGYHPARKLASLFGKSDANLQAEHSPFAGSMRAAGRRANQAARHTTTPSLLSPCE